MAEEWITIQDASRLTGYDEEYLRQIVRKRGDIKAKKFGILWQIEKTSLLGYLEKARRAKDRRHGPKGQRRQT